MMVEFIGSTGSGKTTVATAVQRRLSGLTGLHTAPDLVASLVGLPSPTKPVQRNLVCDLVGLPFFFGSLHRHGAFLRLALLALARQRLTLQSANRLRSTVRKIGVYEIVRRYGDGRIVLVDEGTVLHAHNLFVFTNRDCSSADLDRFARVVPLPDLIVHVRAPLAISIERSLERPDPPRELRSRDRTQVELYVGRARAMFEALVANPILGPRVLAFDNPGPQAGVGGLEVGGLVEGILERAGRARNTV